MVHYYLLLRFLRKALVCISAHSWLKKIREDTCIYVETNAKESVCILANEGIQGVAIAADARAVRPYRSSGFPHATETP